MSLNLCRRNLEDQFLFPTCQGLLHALLQPGLRWTKIQIAGPRDGLAYRRRWMLVTVHASYSSSSPPCLSVLFFRLYNVGNA